MPQIPQDVDAWLRATFTATAASGAASNPSDASLVSSFGSLLSGEFGSITGATNATPIVVTAVAHGLSDGDHVVQHGVQGNEAANGTFVVRTPTADTYALETLAGLPVAGTGTFVAGSAAYWHKGHPDHVGVSMAYVSGTAGLYAVLVPGSAPFKAGDQFRWMVLDSGPYAGKVVKLDKVTVSAQIGG